jgi:hypothetical protein
LQAIPFGTTTNPKLLLSESEKTNPILYVLTFMNEEILEKIKTEPFRICGNTEFLR